MLYSKKKPKLFKYNLEKIYELYLDNTPKELSKQYSFRDHQLRDFLKKNNLKTKKEINKSKITKKDLMLLLENGTVAQLANKYNVSKRTIFNYKKKLEIVLGKRIKKNRRKITDEDKIINSLFYRSIEQTSFKLKISENRIKKLIRVKKSELRQKVINFFDDYEVDYVIYILNSGNINQIVKKLKISKIMLLLILMKLKIKLN